MGGWEADAGGSIRSRTVASEHSGSTECISTAPPTATVCLTGLRVAGAWLTLAAGCRLHTNFAYLFPFSWLQSLLQHIFSQLTSTGPGPS